MKLSLSPILLAAVLCLPAAAQTPAKPANPKTMTAASHPSLQESRHKFVLDVVHSAVGLPQPDPQDRLRVLYAAANVVAPIDNKMAQQFAREGTAIESKLVAEGQRPTVSMLAGGHVDCASVLTFVETVPPAAVLDAEPSLVGAITTCPGKVKQSAERKLQAGLQQGVVAGRAILALMDIEGMSSTWSQSMFAKMFASLPADAASFMAEAPNYAAMFGRAARAMDNDAVKVAGTRLLLWLAKLPDAPQRAVAVNITTGAMSDAIGKDAYDEALRSDVLLQQLVSGTSQNAVLPAPEEESVSVLHAMENTSDRTDALQAMSPSLSTLLLGR